MKIPKLLEPYLNKKVAVFGYGVSGKGVVAVFQKLNMPYVVYDQIKEIGVHDFTDEAALMHRLVVYSPGFSKDHHWLIKATEAGCLCLNELDFASLFWTGKIIAITGTNGKSTLTSLLAEALKKMGFHKTVKCGNIGNSFTEQYEYFWDIEAIAVCEVSSFQAETINYFSPDVVIWTMFDEDHLDRHCNMRSYFEAKRKLVNQLHNENLFIGASVEKFAREEGYLWPITPFIVSESDIINNEGLGPGIFAQLPQIENYLLAELYWISQGFDKEILKEVASSFEPLSFRFKKIMEIYQVGFWNDSKGTNFSATIAALKRFKERVYWIGGGKLKGGDYGMFVSKISPYIEQAFLIGEASLILEEKFRELGVKVQRYLSLEEAIDNAFEIALFRRKSGEIVFSPGFSSLDMFTNAEERGKFFEKKVLELKTTQNHLETIQGY